MSKIIHRDTLDALRANATPPQTPADGMVLELLDHIDAMREHHCFYKWSEVKAARQGGPKPRCTHCGYEAPAVTEADFSDQLRREVLDPAITLRTTVAITLRTTVADATRGMERGR